MTPEGRAARVFGATLLVLVASGFAAMRLVPAFGFTRQEAPRVRPPDSSWYPVFYRGGTHLDHTILWNDFGDSIENARRADVLLLGSSQMLFGVRSHEMRAFERRSGISVFNLGLPFGESSGFPLRLIERFDLRPRVVVANVVEFFKPFETPRAVQAESEGRWTGFATVLEERLAEGVWPLASRILPSFITRRPSSSLLRSSTSGAWMPVRWPHDHVPAVGLRGRPPTVDLVAARRFQKALARRGIGLVLTCVPAAPYDCAPGPVFALAGSLGARAVVPRIAAPLWTVDLVHLCPLSAKRFGRAMLGDLEKVDIVRSIVRRPARPARAVSRERTSRRAS